MDDKNIENTNNNEKVDSLIKETPVTQTQNNTSYLEEKPAPVVPPVSHVPLEPQVVLPKERKIPSWLSWLFFASFLIFIILAVLVFLNLSSRRFSFLGIQRIFKSAPSPTLFPTHFPFSNTPVTTRIPTVKTDEVLTGEEERYIILDEDVDVEDIQLKEGEYIEVIETEEE